MRAQGMDRNAGKPRGPERLAVVCGVAMMLASGCLSPGAAFAEPSVQVLHHLVSEGEAKAMRVYKDALSKQGVVWDDFAVGGTAGESAREVLRARVAAGTPPTAMQMVGFDGLPWAEEGVVADISAIAEEQGWDKVLPEQVAQFMKYDGKWYSAPSLIHRENNVYINKALFEKVGGTLPGNWDELIELGEKFKAAGVVPIATSDEGWQLAAMFDTMIVDLYGAEFYHRVARDLDPEAIKSDQMKSVFERLRKIRSLAGTNFAGRDWAFATGMVINGQAGMQIMGDWAKAEFLAAGKTPDVDFLCVSTPSENPNFMFVIEGWGMFELPDDADRLKGQKEFASLVMTAEIQEQFNLLKGSIPVRLDVKPDKFDSCAQKSMADFKAASASGNLVGSLAHGATNRTEFAAVFDEVISEFFVTEMTPDEAVDRLLAGIDSVR